MLVRFTVDGLPPKKDGFKAVWGKELESERIARLRLAAFDAFAGRPPLEKNIALRVTVHIGPEYSAFVGDLDNHVTGICDGLQKRHSSNINLAPVWFESEYQHVHPDVTLGIKNDSQVTEIVVRKVISSSRWYEVVLEGG